MKVLRLTLLLALGACAHGGSSLPPVAQTEPGAAFPMRSIIDVSSIGVPAPVGYVANLTGNSVTKYAETQNGNQAPVSTLAGAATKLSAPVGVAVDRAGKIYVANGNNTITVYLAGAENDMPPLKTISCGGLNHPAGLAVDSLGNVYVANRSGNSVSIFTSTSTGCVAGNRVLVGAKTGLDAPSSVAVNGAKIYVTNASANSITEYATTATGDTPPSIKISGTSTKLNAPTAVAFDAVGKIYAANAAAVTVYAATATGDTIPFHTIAGSLTLLTGAIGVQVSISGRIFVTNKVGLLNVYAANTNGNVAPSQRISGSLTRLSTPQALALYEPLQFVGIRLNGESATNAPTYGSVLGYFDGLTSTVSQIVHLTAGDPVEFFNVDASLPHTLSFLNNATLTSALFPSAFDGGATASIAGTSIGSTMFSTGALNPGHHSLVYYAAPGLFTVGCAFHYNSNHMRTVIISK